MKALITGSSGFIGKRLANALKKKGFEVLEFDTSSNKSVLDKKQLDEDTKGVDVVFHLAAVLDENSQSLTQVNVFGTQNALEASANNHVKQFVFLSSVGVMGDIDGVADENTPHNPKTRYEKTKSDAEKIVSSYQEVMPVTIVRSAFVLGPNHAWKKIVEMIEKNTPMPGNGENHWQMVYIDDLVDALVFLALNENALGETFIVAEEKPLTLREIVEFIRTKKGVQGELKTIPIETAKLGAKIKSFFGKFSGKKSFLTTEIIDRIARERNYSIEKIKKIGWKPSFDTKTALEKTLEELEKN